MERGNRGERVWGVQSPPSLSTTRIPRPSGPTQIRDRSIERAEEPRKTSGASPVVKRPRARILCGIRSTACDLRPKGTRTRKTRECQCETCWTQVKRTVGTTRKSASDTNSETVRWNVREREKIPARSNRKLRTEVRGGQDTSKTSASRKNCCVLHDRLRKTNRP